MKPLIDEGLVESRSDTADNRLQRQALSRRGRTVYERTLPIMRARQRALQSAMSPAEFQTLLTALDKLEIAAEMMEFDR